MAPKASSSENKLPTPADDPLRAELDEKLAAKTDVAGRVVADKPAAPPPDDEDDDEADDELELEDD